MKTFNDLGIGSNLFVIRKGARLLGNKDKYGNVYHANLKEKKEIIKLSNEDGFLRVNESRNDHRYDLVKIPPAYRDKSSYEDSDSIFFTEEKDYNLHIKNLILSEINKAWQEIVDTKKIKEEYVRSLRVAYYDYLNNTGVKLDNPENQKA